ncbi:Csu type fimbrial protein [Halomonas maura]|uniref:Csu type fimbrial protein n=1 Tax=Halomonas maura TaxID=117606 RepID=UPI0025B61184|nr:spore coat U domain-containing protein [Halomonas maura]MDN3556612.1 spore coat U domain-containing protein [Halomonas maura]
MKCLIGHPLPALLILLVAGLGMPRPAAALLESCEVSATGVSFGTYDPLDASDTEAAGNVEVTCTVVLVGLLVTYDIELSTGGSGTYFPREMASGTNSLEYQLYTDATRATVWGDGVSGTGTRGFNTFLSVGTHTQDYAVYGSIPAGQMVEAGSYSDTITVTVLY